MKIKQIAVLAIVAGLFLGMSVRAAPPAGAPMMSDAEATAGLTPEAMARVKKGEIVIANTQTQVDGGGQALINVAMVFNIPIQEAYKLIRETEKQCEYLDSCDQNILIQRTPTFDVVEFRIKILAWTLKYRVRHQWDDKKYQMWWKLDPSYNNDLKHLEGYWHLYYMDDTHTFARYGTKLVVKDFIPKTVQEALTRRDLPASLESVRKRMNSHGAYKKKGA